MIKKKTAVVIISYLSCAVVILGAMTLANYNRAENYRRVMAANYQHAFDELVTGMNALDTALQKSVYATSASMAGPLCSEVYGRAQICQMALGALPFSTQELEQTSSFISKVGDYASVLSSSAAKGTALDEETMQSLKSLSDTAGLLAGNLRALQTEMLDGRLTMDEMADSRQRMRNVSETAENTQAGATLGSSMRLVEQEFPEIPSLIYDGPFSEHLSTATIKMVEGREAVSEEQARQIAAKFSGLNSDALTMTGRSEGKLPCYWFTAESGKDTLTLAITVQGGEPLNMLSSRQPAASSLSAEDAVKIAKRFLVSRGYTNMVETYHMTQGNVVTVNFCYEQDGVLCYSDLIKVGVACDTGSICNFEARGYLNAHCTRQLAEPSVPVEQAREQVVPGLEVLSERLALVPTPGQNEVLCWEFKCENEEGEHCIIYVDALTGQQEKILILLEDENGTLTI